MKQKLLLVLLLAFSMLMFGTMGCDPDDPWPPPNIDHNFGEMTDPRDDQTYETIQIGTQTWMAENLNYVPETGNSWCYNNDTNNCNTYGRLYTWNTALTACPPGWSLPSDEEWTVLTDFLGDNAGGKMKSTGTIEAGTGLWGDPNTGATNESGWSGLPGGSRYRRGGSFRDLGSDGGWWSASEGDADDAWGRGLRYIVGAVSRGSYDKVRGFSVRCLRD